MCIRQSSGDKTKSTNSNNKNKLLWGILVIFMPFFFNVIHLPLVNNNNQNHTGTFLAASTASATKATTISGTTTTATATTNEFGLLVVHCKEPNMTFLNQVPDDWFLRVYETCGGQRSAGVVRRQNDSAVFVPFNNYRRSEECSAYLDFIVQNYHQLPTIVIFMQSDGLQGYGKPHRNFSGHSPFRTIAQMEHVTREILLTTTTTKHNNGNSNNQTTTATQFLHYGPILNRFGLFVLRRSKSSPVFVDLWTNHFALPLPGNNSSHKDDATAAASGSDVWVESRPSAIFAVHRDRIRARPRETYANLRNAILDFAARGGDTRYYCWDLEITWHVLFGEPYVLPKSSTLDHIPRPMF